MGFDWIGIFRCSRVKCAGNGDDLLHTYPRTRIEGHGVIGPSSATLEGAVAARGSRSASYLFVGVTVRMRNSG